MLAWALITAAKERWGFDLGWILAGSEGPADWEDSEEKIEDATDEGYWEQQTDSSEDDRATGVDTEGTTTGSEVEWFECENEDDTPFVHKVWHWLLVCLLRLSILMATLFFAVASKVNHGQIGKQCN